MATRQSTIDFLLDQLSILPDVRARKMFGEYALYCGDKVVALVCDDQLFVKITPQGRTLVGERYVEGEAYPGAKPSMLIGAEEIDDGERLCELIRLTADALPAPKPKSSKAARSKRPK
jgi:TfoX/Sxy family transcriptional regulator of competence genes